MHVVQRFSKAPGIFIVPCGVERSLEHAKKSFYRASEKVSIQLIKSKCLPILLYGLEACPLTTSDLQSLDFVINRFFMKLFTTKKY